MTAQTPGRAVDLEQVMHEMPYGMYIVGSAQEGEANGMIADWVMQVSFEPRALAVSFENDSRSLGRIRATRMFTVNFLSGDQIGMDLAGHFLQPYEGSKIGRRSALEAAKKHHKLEDVDHTLTDSGCPILSDALAWLECEATDFIAVGDHTLVIGSVVDGDMTGQGDVLTSTCTGWMYSG